MQSNIFNGIFDSELVNTISLMDFISCIVVAVIAGFLLAVAYTFKNT